MQSRRSPACVGCPGGVWGLLPQPHSPTGAHPKRWVPKTATARCSWAWGAVASTAPPQLPEEPGCPDPAMPSQGLTRSRQIPTADAGTRTSAAWSLPETGDAAQCCLLTGGAGVTGGQGEQAGPFPRNAGVPHGAGGDTTTHWLWWKSPVSVGARGGGGGVTPAEQTESPHPEDAKPHGVRGLGPGRDRCRIKPSGRSTGLGAGVSPFIGQRPTGTQFPQDLRQLQLCRSCPNEREPDHTVTGQVGAGAPVPCAAGTRSPGLRWPVLGSPLPPPAPRQGSPPPPWRAQGKGETGVNGAGGFPRESWSLFPRPGLPCYKGRGKTRAQRVAEPSEQDSALTLPTSSSGAQLPSRQHCPCSGAGEGPKHLQKT